jgi:hypothetical protein
MNLELKAMEDKIREEARQEKGCCFYIYAWFVRILTPFGKLGL